MQSTRSEVDAEVTSSAKSDDRLSATRQAQLPVTDGVGKLSCMTMQGG